MVSVVKGGWCFYFSNYCHITLAITTRVRENERIVTFVIVANLYTSRVQTCRQKDQQERTFTTKFASKYKWSWKTIKLQTPASLSMRDCFYISSYDICTRIQVIEASSRSWAFDKIAGIATGNNLFPTRDNSISSNGHSMPVQSGPMSGANERNKRQHSYVAHSYQPSAVLIYAMSKASSYLGGQRINGYP